jgi:hypothetical protein|nr:MAG TPA: hypothetical protein [Bacteriophage sp.]
MAEMTSNGLMRLPHFTSSKTSVEKYEPIYQNLFTLTLSPPPALGKADD